VRNPREVRARVDGNPRAIRPKTCFARKSKTARPVELTAGPRAPTTENQNGGASVLRQLARLTTAGRWQFRRRAGEHPPRARPRTRPRRAARVRARRLARDDPLVARAVPSRSRRDTRGGSRDRSPSVSYPAASERVFTRRAHRLRGGGWPAPSRPRSPRAPSPHARVERADPAAASSGKFASRPRPTRLIPPPVSSSLAATRFADASHALSPCAADPPRASPPPALHTQPSRVQTVHRRRERPSRPRGRPSRPTAAPTRTPPPRAKRGRATGRRHRY
jgi:hypothetical protein